MFQGTRAGISRKHSPFMRQRKINPGNAESVIQRGNNITIVPFDDEARLSVSSTERRSIRWPLNIDVIGGGAPPNPDNIDVNDDLFPGWRAYAYHCASGTCTSPLQDPLYIEIENTLSETWTNAFMVMRINHVGATSTEYLFRVKEMYICQDTDGVSLSDITEDNSGISNPNGVYSFQIAATANDGTKRMTAFTSAPSRLATVKDSDQVEDAYNDMTNPVIIYPQGFFAPFGVYGANFMLPTGPNQIAGISLTTFPFMIRYTP